jgi:hypothetical protein
MIGPKARGSGISPRAPCAQRLRGSVGSPTVSRSRANPAHHPRTRSETHLFEGAPTACNMRETLFARLHSRVAPRAEKGLAGAPKAAQATLACSPQSVRQTGQFTAPRSSHRAIHSWGNACPQRRRPAPPKRVPQSGSRQMAQSSSHADTGSSTTRGFGRRGCAQQPAARGGPPFHISYRRLKRPPKRKAMIHRKAEPHFAPCGSPLPTTSAIPAAAIGSQRRTSILFGSSRASTELSASQGASS